MNSVLDCQKRVIATGLVFSLQVTDRKQVTQGRKGRRNERNTKKKKKKMGGPGLRRARVLFWGMRGSNRKTGLEKSASMR